MYELIDGCVDGKKRGRKERWEEEEWLNECVGEWLMSG